MGRGGVLLAPPPAPLRGGGKGGRAKLEPGRGGAILDCERKVEFSGFPDRSLNGRGPGRGPERVVSRLGRVGVR